MAHLWFKDSAREWAAMPLASDVFVLAREQLDSKNPSANAASRGSARLLCRRGPDGEQWFMLAGIQSSWRINGVPIRAGLRQLYDRDEIRDSEYERVYFSTESLAVVAPFPGSDHSIFCPRCKQEIAVHDMAVRCPQCANWYHQTADFPCWPYAEKCSLCDQLTSVDAGYRWSPDSL